MRLVIDAQGMQTSGSRSRGIGRYSASLLGKLLELRKNHEVFIALNGSFPETIEPIRTQLSGCISAESIVVWSTLQPVGGLAADYDARRKVSERMREEFLASLHPDLVLVTSLFEGAGDDAVTSIGTRVSNFPTAVILYDVIPLVHRSVYLRDPQIERWYLTKVDHLRRANLLLSISEASRVEGIEYLGIDPEDVVNISAACDRKFVPRDLNGRERERLHRIYGLTRSFVMYTGGIDSRKNIDSLIRAYARLPEQIRKAHQLALVCAVQPGERSRLEQFAKACGLGVDELVVTGFVPDTDLVDIYNLCKLFVFPSWHEGFGLPALEAMTCGRAVIAADRSSLPEVIGREDALFNPFDETAIASVIERGLTDDEWRLDLERHAVSRAARFSWEASASRAWSAIEAVSSRSMRPSATGIFGKARPRLAYVSPLPPDRSGIADYSAELLPELSKHYEIDVIVTRETVTDPWICANCRIRDVNWFRAHAEEFDRVMYHMGNSEFHAHMFELIRDWQGVVVLHDFFLTGVIAYLGAQEGTRDRLIEAVQRDHGYAAALEARGVVEPADLGYPCNLEIFQNARGVIVHSEYSRDLVRAWYGSGAADRCRVIPLLRQREPCLDRGGARSRLGIGEQDFVVCSFGLLGAPKLNKELLDAWLASGLVRDRNCRLIFVGGNEGGPYGASLRKSIDESEAAGRIEITGWVDREGLRKWLMAADVAVQLRTLSRGETSAAVLDCLNHGVATIVNAHGSMNELRTDSVWMLPDEFSSEQLAEALLTLRWDTIRRRTMSERGREVIRSKHCPRTCAEEYSKAIERFYAQSNSGSNAFLDGLRRTDLRLGESDLRGLARALAENHPPSPRRRQLLVDVTRLVAAEGSEAWPGMVSLLEAVLTRAREDEIAVEPVYVKRGMPGYTYARSYTCRLLGLPGAWADEPAEAWPGDVFFGLCPGVSIDSAQEATLMHWNRRGIRVFFAVYSLAPVFEPERYPASVREAEQHWLRAVVQFDGVTCLSSEVADDMRAWLDLFQPKRGRELKIGWPGFDAKIEIKVGRDGWPPDAPELLAALSSRPSFMLVTSTTEAIRQTREAFEILWQIGKEINLILLGEAADTEEDLRADRGGSGDRKYLFLVHGATREKVEKLAAVCTPLFVSDRPKDYGRLLNYARLHRLRAITRDIVAFREIGAEDFFYFADDDNPAALAGAIQTWLASAPGSPGLDGEGTPSLNWKEAAARLSSLILGDSWQESWRPHDDEARRFLGSDPRLLTQIGQCRGRTVRTTGREGMLVYGPYIPLTRGRYRISIRGSAVAWTGDEWVDVTTSGGDHRLVHATMGAMNSGSWCYTGTFALEKDAQDLEFRMWVEQATDIAIDGIELEPLPFEIGPQTEGEVVESDAERSTKGQAQTHETEERASDQ